ncbi:putative N6-adenine methyltransferase [Popillia japonica]|uniref:Protein-lysine N-methyltransferase QE152_g21829 n=1 Tax=Popillia japonica TaxID=7064 RepID=A0AAW1KKH3_POPJA
MINNQLDHIDDDVPQLSTETFAALQEFYKEQEQNEASSSTANSTISSTVNNAFQENWQLSQFWYDDKTANAIAKIVHKTLMRSERVALISCPTLYKPLKNILCMNYDVPVHLYEYDTRFAIYGCEFIKYDYNSPLNIPQMYRSYYDLVIADPPFLSEECLRKTAETIKYISNDKIILCTGAVMEPLVKELLSLNKAQFKPSHKNNLANEFCCFANYDIDRLL